MKKDLKRVKINYMKKFLQLNRDLKRMNLLSYYSVSQLLF